MDPRGKTALVASAAMAGGWSGFALAGVKPELTPERAMQIEAQRRQQERWLATSKDRYERRVAAAAVTIDAAQAKRDRRAAKRAGKVT